MLPLAADVYPMEVRGSQHLCVSECSQGLSFCPSDGVLGVISLQSPGGVNPGCHRGDLPITTPIGFLPFSVSHPHILPGASWNSLPDELCVSNPSLRVCFWEALPKTIDVTE